MREIKYSKALSEGMVEEMERNKDIFITGISVDYPSGIFGTTTEASKRFGPKRVFDAPAMENALMGIAIGAAAVGKRPIIVSPRADFMFLSFDMLLQLAAKWKYMFGGNGGTVPVVVRMIIGRGWGQGSTHSQSLQSTLAHFPGLTVVMPAFPADAKGLMISALRHNGPVVILEYRTLYDTLGEVPEDSVPVPLGKANIIREGSDVTIVATSFMSYEALHAATELESQGVSAEVVDLRTISPLDEETILNSIKKTGHLVVADTSWELCGVSSEIAALAAEKGFNFLKAPVRRIALAACPAPVSQPLEKAFYPTAATIVKAVMVMLGRSAGNVAHLDRIDNFKGPY
ncbi:transketolase C-terminal domain-containing protein [Daejeonella sp.]|uniref:alpha-ketoacid dehydrogenase subunit beta n=1 Tax=Daejeonella sp. TaxID=2805397 RepID=UPI0030BF619D